MRNVRVKNGKCLSMTYFLRTVRKRKKERTKELKDNTRITSYTQTYRYKARQVFFKSFKLQHKNIWFPFLPHKMTI